MQPTLGVLQCLTSQLCGIFAWTAAQGFPGPASAPALILRPTLELSPAFPGLGSRSLSRAQQEQHPWSMYKKLSLLCVPSALPYG